MRAVRVRLAALALGGVLVAAGVLVLVPVAHASCAGPPLESEHAFVGTVVDTSEGDRVASVVTDDGERVTVQGTVDTSWLSESASSTDRRYAVGGRYEFHPLDASDPFQDNACTATRQLAGPSLAPPERAREYLPGWLPVDEQAGPVGYLLFLAPVLGALLGLGLLARWGARRWQSSHR